MKELISTIAQLKLNGVNLLALVTKTSDEVVFYATVNGKIMQSNSLAEEGLLDPLVLDDFCHKIANIIRSSKKFKEDMMNIVKVSTNNEIDFSYESTSARLYAIRKNWKASLGL